MIQISWEKMLRISENVAQNLLQNFNDDFNICYNKLQILINSYFTKAKSSENGYLLEFEWKGEGGGRLFEAGRLLTFSAFRMGGYSSWALIRINTVFYHYFDTHFIFPQTQGQLQ